MTNRNGKIIDIALRKGGVGKTTTANEIAFNLGEKKCKVLKVDLDPSSNLSRISNAALADVFSIYDVLKANCPIEGAIQSISEYCDIIVAHDKLTSAEKEFNSYEDIYILLDQLSKVRSSYDFIIIDTPPNLGVLTSMALTAADFVLIPTEATSSGVQGLSQLLEKIQRVQDPRRGTNVNLKIAGILITRLRTNTNFEDAMKSQITKKYLDKDIHVFDTSISNSVVVEESQLYKKSIYEYAPKSKPALDYKNATEELLDIII